MIYKHLPRITKIFNKRIIRQQNFQGFFEEIFVLDGRLVCKGWALLNDEANKAIIEINCFDKVVAVGTADLIRQDLVGVVSKDGRNAFEIILPMDFSEKQLGFITAKVVGEKSKGQLNMNGFKIDDACYLLKEGEEKFSQQDEKGNYQAEDISEPLSHNDLLTSVDRIEIYFDEEFYLCNNPDILDAEISPLDHYKNFGWKELRDPTSWFSVSGYLSENPDIQQAGCDPFEHYLLFGQEEGRNIGKNGVSKHDWSSEELESIGCRIYAPLLYYFLLDIKEYVENNKLDSLYFLTREGYFLKELYDKGVELGIVPQVKTKLLMTSRAFLFRNLLLSGKDVELSLSSRFQGSLRYLLLHRFCLSESEINSFDFTVETLNEEIVLPDNKSYVKSLLERKEKCLLNDENVYIDYLSSIGFLEEEKPTVVDLGYAGTIQKSLSLLLDKSIDGYYFINSNKRSSVAINKKKCNFYGCFGNGLDFNSGEPLLNKSLILEGLLTAPYGQLRNIIKVDGEYIFIRGPNTVAQRNFYYLESVMKGVYSFIEDIGGGRKGHDFKNDIKELFANEVSQKSLFYELLELDDFFSGLGTINPNINQ